jgi:hypothetical protein
MMSYIIRAKTEVCCISELQLVLEPHAIMLGIQVVVMPSFKLALGLYVLVCGLAMALYRYGPCLVAILNSPFFAFLVSIQRLGGS